MAIFAISDLHLSLSTDKPMDIFGSNWENYTERMRENWNRIVSPEDLVLIPGDISWAMYLQEAQEDFSYINALNGQKILLRGNHDYWWTTLNKMERFVEEQGFDTLHFIKNTAFLWNGTAICGTRGWTIAGAGASAEDKKIYERERQRILLSLEDAKALHPDRILGFHALSAHGKGRSSAGIYGYSGVLSCVGMYFWTSARLRPAFCPPGGGQRDPSAAGGL